VDEEGDADVDAVRRGVAVLAEAVPLLANPYLFSIDQSYLTDYGILKNAKSMTSLWTTQLSLSVSRPKFG
jgi:hypothetical protein